MKVRAYAKVNLALDVVSEREDGYHDLSMIMAPITLHDLVIVNVIDEGIEITCDNSYVPTDGRNIVYKVAALMKETFKIEKGVHIHIYKHIPMQAGLAGGSADGAALLRAMNDLFHLNQSMEQLAALGLKVGSDIPFCLYNQFALVEGTGDQLSFFQYDGTEKLLLVRPRMGVSTKYAYENVDLETCPHPDCLKMKDAMESGDYEGMLSCMANSLEQPALTLVEDIARIKEKMMALGFDNCMMSGSGSCVFGITRSDDVLNAGFKALKNRYPFVLRTQFLKK